MNAIGLFVTFEGIDGSGKGTQIGETEKAIRSWNKYQDVVLTREPTWRTDELRQRLITETDPTANGGRMTMLFVSDRGEHYHKDIRADIERRRVVLCDRYSMSTLAYQSAQGEPMLNLISAHFTENIKTPDITFYLALDQKEASRRISERGEKREKFENVDFAKKLVEQHEFIYKESQREGAIKDLIGKIVKIDATQEPKFVTTDILEHLKLIYCARLAGQSNL